jgi:adenine-specific DNA-methyltransferase
VIYIDPPYNTGNKDFKYNDDFVDKEDAYRHSKWLSFMKRRLGIAHDLLSDNGVIFISIDDNEQAQLKLLCDEVFGENNYVGTYFWKRTSTPPALSYKIRKKLEFVLCYQKASIPQRTFAQGYVDGGDVPLLNAGNPIGTLSFPIGSCHFNISDGTYTAQAKHKIKLLNDVKVISGINSNEFKAQGNFKWGQQNLDREVCAGTYFLIKSNRFSPRFQKSTQSTKVPSNIIDAEVDVGTNEEAQKEIDSINLSKSFDYAKPTSLLSYLIKMPFWYKSNITILDFFAGSGTTLHATMKLNSEDGGHRQCILITNNENKICEEVTYIRNKKVIEGYTTPTGKDVPGLKNNNLRYYKTDFISRKRTIKNMRALVSASTELLCIKNNVYTEQHTFGERTLKTEAARYFDDGKTKMLVIYNELGVNKFVDMLRTMKVEGKIKVYVFSSNRYAYNDDFQEVLDKVELCALPAAIYDAYNAVLKPMKNEDDAGKVDTDDKEPEGTYQQEILHFNEEGGKQ